MISVIRSGRSGDTAHVTPRGQLLTDATVTGAPGFHARQGQGNTYAMSTDWVPVNTTSNMCFLWGKTLSAAKNGIVIKKIELWYNGGNTSGNKHCIFRLRVGTPEPTANIATPPADTHTGNTNLGSTSTIPMLLYQTSDPVNGLTVASNGNFAGSFPVKDYYKTDSEDSVIMTPDVSMCMFVQAEEVGYICLNFLAYVLPEVN